MLRLRPYKNSDAEYVARWITDEKMYWQWSAGRLGDYPFSPEKLNKYYEEQTAIQEFFVMTMIDEEGVPRGQFLMRYLNPNDSTTVRLGFIIVDSSIRGKGYGKAMLNLAFTYAKNCLHAEEVTLGVFKNNPAAIHCYEAAGLAMAADKESCWYQIKEEEWECLEMKIIWKSTKSL